MSNHSASTFSTMRYHKITILFCCFIYSLASFSQKHDNVWLFGYGSNTVDSTFGGTRIDFSNIPEDIHYEYRPMNFNVTCASMCDKTGNLLFYTNGIYIANYLHEKIPSSDSLSPGALNNDYYTVGYPLEQGLIILPLPDSESIFYIFHERWPYGAGVDKLYYTTVDMEMNNGQGGILEKRVEAIVDTLETGQLTAVKHANGTDWWILVREYKSQSYHRLLLTHAGVEYAGHQSIGATPYGVEVLGQAVFSPDGKKYVRYGAFSYALGNYLEYFDFDRCTGELSNPGFINHLDSAGSAGAAISANSRFLYCSSGRYIYQYDFEAADFAASKDTVAVYDGFASPFGTRFFLAQLAPNGKIYINTPNGNNVLHVIHEPDKKAGRLHGGTARRALAHLQFLLHAQLPELSAGRIPAHLACFYLQC